MCPGSCHGSQCTGRLGKAHDSAVTIFQQTGPQNSLGSCHCAYPALSFHVFPLSLPQEVILGTRTPHCTWRQRGVVWGQRGKEPEATSGATAPEICRPVLRPASPVTAASGSASVTTALASPLPAPAHLDQSPAHLPSQPSRHGCAISSGLFYGSQLSRSLLSFCPLLKSQLFHFFPSQPDFKNSSVGHICQWTRNMYVI